MEHTLEIHIKTLDELCRTCGRLNLTAKQKQSYEKPRLCDSLIDILLIYGIDISKDFENTHSKFICVNCVRHQTW